MKIGSLPNSFKANSVKKRFMSIEEKPPETRCLSSNREVVEKGLAFDTFGNVSIREKEYCFIKPSGIELNICTEEDISQLRIDNGEIVKGH